MMGNMNRHSPPDGDPVRAIGYIRVSTKKQGHEGYGLAAQRDSITAYCEREGYELLTVIPDVISGGKSERAYGQAAAIEAIRAGIADVLIINTLDRASRDLIAGRKLIAAAHDEGWRVIGLDGTDSADEQQAFMNNMRLLFAEEERKKISERTKAGLRRAKREGKPLGKPSTIPREIVDRIVAMRTQEGVGAKSIATRLTNENVPSPGGGIWHYSTVRGVLRREGVA